MLVCRNNTSQHLYNGITPCTSSGFTLHTGGKLENDHRMNSGGAQGATRPTPPPAKRLGCSGHVEDRAWHDIETYHTQGTCSGPLKRIPAVNSRRG